MAINHIVFIIMDSCRYDACVAAHTPNIDRIGTVEKRYAYASWTAPSHYTFTMGLLPHKSPKEVFASEIYKEEFVQWVDRTGIEPISFAHFLPAISLPKVLGNLGYRTTGRVSMPVLNQHTLIGQHFDDYKLMDNHNDFAGMVEEMTFPDDEPQYYFLNLGETHYPYMLTDQDLPIISGVHGVFKALGNDTAGQTDDLAFFNQKTMDMLRQQQICAVEYLDKLIGKLMEKTPENTHFIVSADHGELFGEDGYFGHGPIMHEKCFEVPFVEGRIK